ncbi:hypothetical protein [Streptobacillus notomytis]|uniref:hypothetical protein n=1 Tax=Streptobacillus notomytis TaxID=1712031 RepID=UPI000AD93472|nr:hypothetical protein [Streptobacillus notomytis]
MENICVDRYKELIKERRKIEFKLGYDNFIKMGYDTKIRDFFFDNASEIVETLREKCCNEFYMLEKEITYNILKK